MEKKPSQKYKTGNMMMLCLSIALYQRYVNIVEYMYVGPEMTIIKWSSIVDHSWNLVRGDCPYVPHVKMSSFLFFKIFCELCFKETRYS